MLKQMIKHAVVHKKNCKYYIMDILVLFWYSAYIPTYERIKGLQNPYRLNTAKAMGKGLLRAVSELSIRAYLDEFISQEDLEYNRISSYVMKRTSLSIYVFLYHLSVYNVLEYSVDYYLKWLADSNYKWLDLPKDVDFDTLRDSVYYIIPEEIPVIGGKKLGCIYKYFEQYKDYYIDTYSDCDVVPDAVRSILRHQRRSELIPAFRE